MLVKDKSECVWKNQSTGVWSGEGCAVNEVYEDSIQCACSHLTEFSLVIRSARTKQCAKAPTDDYVFSSLFGVVMLLSAVQLGRVVRGTDQKDRSPPGWRPIFIIDSTPIRSTEILI